MDPVSIATESYKVGGLNLVCLAMLALIVILVLRFAFKRIEKQDNRINQVEENRAKLAEGAIKDNTAVCHAVIASNGAVVKACEGQTEIINRLITVMGERPCFNSQTVPVIPPPRRDRTPLPQRYGPK